MKNVKLQFRTFVLPITVLCGLHSSLSGAVGELLGYGNNFWGQLSQPSSLDVFEPTLVDQNVVSVATGENHTLYLTSDGCLFAMGRNHFGQLGDGTFEDRNSPVFITKGVKQISANGNCSAFVTHEGQLWGMGDNKFKQLGDPQNDPFIYSERDFTYDAALHQYLVCAPVLIAEDVEHVELGKMHTLFLKDDHKLWAVGRNECGEFGNGNPTIGPLDPMLVAIKVIAFAAGDSVSYYIDESNNLWAAGYNGDGQLGLIQADGRPGYEFSFVSDQVASVSAGKFFAAFITTDGSLYGMGSNEAGQLGGDTFENTMGMPFVLIDEAVETVSCGDTHLVYTGPDGTLYGMGNSENGKLSVHGDMDFTRTQIARVDGAKMIAAGGQQTLFIRDGDLFSLGSNDYGQQGIAKYSLVTEPIHMVSDARRFSAGSCFTLFVDNKDQLWGIGRNDSAQLGAAVDRVNDEAVLLIPNEMFSNMKIKDAVAGYSYSLFLTTEGELYGMGSNRRGQLGLGHNFHVRTPKLIEKDVEGMAAGSEHCMFWTTDGVLYAMGKNESGQLGDGTTIDRHTPVKIAEKVEKAAVTYSHSLILKTDHQLFAVGGNESKQLAREGGNVSTPVFVAEKVKDIAAGSSISLFIDENGVLFSVGRGRSTPRVVHKHVVSVSCKNAAVYYVTEDGELYSSYEEDVIAEDVAEVSVSGHQNHIVFSCNQNYKSEERLHVYTTVVTQNAWPLDPEGILAEDAIFSVYGLPEGLSIENKHLVGTIDRSGFYSFEVLGEDSGDVVKTAFYINVLKEQKYPLFLGANINGRFIPTEGGHLDTLRVSIDSTQRNSIQLITDSTVAEVPNYDRKGAFTLIDGVSSYIHSFLSFSEHLGSIVGIPANGDYTTQLGEIDSKISFRDSRGEGSVNLLIDVE